MMRKSIFIFLLAMIMVTAGTATANTGRFTSFSTTVTRSPGQLNFNAGVDTTGAYSPGTTDYVLMFGAVLPTTGTSLSTGVTTYLPRAAVGAGAFGGSFSITGLNDNASYKWLTFAVGNMYGTGTGYTGLFYGFYFLLYGCLPFPTTAPIFITTPGGTTPIPVACTTTGTATPTGPLYQFLNSDINTFHTTINWWYSTTSGSAYPLWANGVSTGRIGALGTPIPTLSSWGFLALGTLLGMTGFILLRRG